MKNILRGLLAGIFVVFTFMSCSKEGTVATAQLNEYAPTETGKFIRYRLDSMRFIDFGQRDTIISYDAKDVIEEQVTDNAGRTAYRVTRYLRNVASNSDLDYVANLTYLITPSREAIEVMENNLKYQKLRLPVKDGYSWRGNTYLPTTPFFTLFDFSNDEGMDLWDYTYQNVNQSVEIDNVVYDSTATVLQIADSSNVPIEFPDGLAYRNYWAETWAKNIGLIYKEVVMWEYQPPISGNPGFRSGFGLKMTIIDHN